MSVKRFLESPEVRREFAERFPIPKFLPKKELAAEPKPTNYSLVGTAFDYLFRFLLQRLNVGAVTTEWMAEKVICRTGSTEVMLFDSTIYEEVVRDLLRTAKTNHSQFMRTGVIGDDLIRSSLHLAQLDLVARRVSPIEKVNLGVTSEDDLADLRSLIELVDPKKFQAKDVCVLNPGFGTASAMVKGADADILLDGLLLEVKTVKKLDLKQEYFHQLVAYYLLACIGGIEGLKKKPVIDSLGIYFSRHAEVFSLPISDVIGDDDLQTTLAWFQNLIAEHYGRQ